MIIEEQNMDKFSSDLVKTILENEDKFITNLFEILPIPISALQRGFDDDDLVTVSKNKIPKVENSTTRARTLEELHNKLNEMKSKKNFSYKEKLTKKGLKNRIKKKEKKMQKNLRKKDVRNKKSKNPELENTENVKEEQKIKQDKPVFNSQAKMVFSKFDFPNKKKNSMKKTKNDPHKILKDIEKQNEKLKELKESGEKEKAEQLKQKHIWKTALAKAEGQKVKDDPILLKKSIQKREQEVKKSKKKWDARKEGVQKAKEEKQKKRLENINKRKKVKKLNKLKKAAKKGKIIPGL